MKVSELFEGKMNYTDEDTISDFKAKLAKIDKQLGDYEITNRKAADLKLLKRRYEAAIEKIKLRYRD